jgi:hypothetical protein
MRIPLAVALAGALAAFDVCAAAQRTFVASSGNDANPCSLLAPCRGFAAAIAQTNAGGEVVVLDSAGYGTIPSISQSITISAPPGVYAGISVASGDGITIDGAGVPRVVLRGLTINGQGGNNGVTIATVSSVYIENCTVANMEAIGVDAQHGVLHMSDTVVRANGTIGVRVQGPASAQLDRIRVEGHASYGIEAINGARVAIADSVVSGNFIAVYVFGDTALVDDTAVSIARSDISTNMGGITAQSTSAGALVRADVSDTEVARNFGAAVAVLAAGGGIATIAATRSVVSGSGVGMQTNGANATLLLDGNTITQNQTGVFGLSGTVLTRSNNTLRDNGTDNSFSGTTTGFIGF